VTDQIVVTGLKEIVKGAAAAGKATQIEVRAALAKSGEIVRADAAPRLAKYSTKSAAGLKVVVRQRGIAVEQSLRKTDGPKARRNYPGIQMRDALLPAVAERMPEVEAEFEKAVDTIARIFAS
jgi:hypothetical protein